jgi:hypothetical protein
MMVNMMGPYGTGLGNTRDFSSMIAIGTGTGIVPMISHFRKNIRLLVRLEPVAFYEMKHRRREESNKICLTTRERGTVIQLIAQWLNRLCGRSTNHVFPMPMQVTSLTMDQAATRIIFWFKKASLEKHGPRSAVLAAALKRQGSITFTSCCGLIQPFFTVYLVSCLGLMFSFSNQRYRPADEMADLLRCASAIALVLFFVMAIYGSVAKFQTYADLIVGTLGFVVLQSNIRIHQTSLGFDDHYVTALLPPDDTAAANTNFTTKPAPPGMLRDGPPWSGGLGVWEQTVYAVFFLYMIARTWTHAVGEQGHFRVLVATSYS